MLCSQVIFIGVLQWNVPHNWKWLSPFSYAPIDIAYGFLETSHPIWVSVPQLSEPFILMQKLKRKEIDILKADAGFSVK